MIDPDVVRQVKAAAHALFDQGASVSTTNVFQEIAKAAGRSLETILHPPQREVLERDEQGREVLIVYRESESERAERIAEQAEQAKRGQAVARSVHAERAEDIVAHADELAQRFETDPPPGATVDATALRAVRYAHEDALRAAERLHDAVVVARGYGHSWAVIGAMIGLSAKQVRDRYAKKTK